MTWRPAATAATLALALTGCGSGLDPLVGGDAQVHSQIAHPNGAVLQTLSLRGDGERALVSARVLNGRDSEIRLKSSDTSSYIVTDNGEKLMLIESPANPALAIPAGKSMDVDLVFAGKLPHAGSVTMILNANSSNDNQYTSTPRFQAALPLDGAWGRSIPETSATANMQPLPMTRLRAADAGGSALGGATSAASALQAVETLKSELGAVETDRGTMVSLAGDVTFDFDKATIRDAARPTLDRLAQLIAAGDAGQITIEGHTDAKGDDGYNKRLSEQRADAVKAYLAARGVAADRLKTIGLGELRPVAPNAKSDGGDDEDGRQRNRRVEVILPKAAAAPAVSASATTP